MLVDVVHPAIVRHRPVGGRSLRNTLVRMESPVELRVASPGTVRDIGTIEPTIWKEAYDPPGRRRRVRVAACEHGGHAYAPLLYRDASAGETPVDVETLEAYLRGELYRSSKLDGMVQAFHGTPLQDLDGFAALQGGHEDGRGMPYDPERQREVASDGREAARSTVREFLDAELLICRDRGDASVWKRLRPTVRYATRQVEWRSLDLSRADFLWVGPAVAPDRIEGLAAYAGGVIPDRVREAASETLALHPTLAGDDSDFRHAIACIAGSAARWLNSAKREKTGDPGETGRRIEALEPFHLALRIGRLPDRDLPDAVAEIRRSVGHLAATTEPKGSHADHVDRALDCLERLAPERLARIRPVDASDLDALEGLAP